MKHSVLAFALVAAGALAASSAVAQSEPQDLRQTYSGVTSVPIADIETYNTYANGSGTTNSFNVDTGTFSFDDPFLKSSANPPISTMFAGVWFDGDGFSHLVLALGSGYASDLVAGQQDFSSLFPNYTESNLINDLITIDNFTNPATLRDPAQSELVNFYGEVGNQGGLTSAFGGPLTLVAFSSGSPVGSGVATVTRLATGAVPEPATWTMMLLGFGMVGYGLRYRRKSQTANLSFA